MKAYTFVKNIGGQLRITLETYNMQNAAQDFVMPAGVDKVIVPYQYALGLFVTPAALSQYKLGYFTIENVESLIEEATQVGLTIPQDRNKVLSLRDIAQLIQSGNTNAIEDLLRRGNPVERDNLFLLVRENYDKIPSGVLTKIETVCGVELKVDE